MTRTLREISYLCKAISQRRKQESVFNASLHGLKLNSDSETESDTVELSQEQEAAMKKARAQALERKQKLGR